MEKPPCNREFPTASPESRRRAAKEVNAQATKAHWVCGDAADGDLRWEVAGARGLEGA